ncbi:arginase [soil metagenome]
MKTIDRVAVMGAQLDLGASRRGVDMGPSAIRYAGLAERIESLGIIVDDLGNISVEIPEIASIADRHARYLPEILGACARLGAQVAGAASEGRVPLVLGGDHSIAMGTLAGLHSANGPGGVLWLDAHGDLNSPENSPSGNVHGMPLAAALGACGFELDGLAQAPWVEKGRTAVIGARQLDPGERELIESLGLCVLTMTEVDRRGIASVMHEALSVVQCSGFVHVSFDVDVLAPEIAPGVGTPVRGGLTYREAHLAMELVAESGMLSSMEVVEVNPMFDHGGVTVSLGVELIASALGSRIL